jgi:hypothetical protein
MRCYTSSDHTNEEEVTHPLGRDRTKPAARKVKGKEDSSSRYESSSAVAGMMSTLKKLSILFTEAQLWKQ